MHRFAVVALALGIPLICGIDPAEGSGVVPHDWRSLVCLAIGSQVIGQGLLVFAIGRLSPVVVGIVLLSQPLVSALVGFAAYGERMTGADIAGALALAAALVLIRQRD